MKKKQIFKKLNRKGFKPEHVAEVGVFHPETSNVYDYINLGVKCTLVEPDPKSIELINKYFSAFKNVTLHPYAIFDREGEIELIQRRASTFVKELPSSPSIINDNYQIQEEDKFIAKCKTFDFVDDGTIDFLSIDIEGSEWYVIKSMVSRPAVISVETHGASYINPFINEITEYMNLNNYLIWYKTGSDTIYVQNDKIEITFFDELRLKFKNFRLGIRRRRKLLQKKLKKSAASA